MKKILIVITVFALSLWAVNTFAPVHGEEKIYDSVVRLHVIANSDSAEDQALKLAVRDAILDESASCLENARDRQSAELALSEAIPRLTERAAAVIEEHGFDYPCSITLSKENYPERSYENVCFPSGRYSSLQVKIGDHNGQNFWCVLFPALCLNVATSPEKEFVEVGLTPDQYKIITESDSTKYKIRFRFLEVIEEAIEK